MASFTFYGFINIIFAILTAAAGIAFAFLPVQDRPLDIWIKNLWKRLNAPTQYTYHKSNPPVAILQNLYYISDPHKTVAHIESREMLASYLQRTQPQQKPNPKRNTIEKLLQNKDIKAAQRTKTPLKKGSTPLPAKLTAGVSVSAKPTLIGTIKNNKKIPLPGVLIYIKTKDGAPVRLLKTNPHGVFATFHELPVGEYIIEPKDPKGGYFFDTMKLAVSNKPLSVLDIHSKEIL